jgi:N-methylhydantoinase B/oxoprolinase/acetone carboxylase alpha subunit
VRVILRGPARNGNPGLRQGQGGGGTRVTGAQFPPGATVVYHTAGGGGWGDPLQRDPAAVLNDVLQGYVSLARATTTAWC